VCAAGTSAEDRLSSRTDKRRPISLTNKPRYFPTIVCALLVVATACTKTPAPLGIHFVDGGIIIENPDDSSESALPDIKTRHSLGADRELLISDWEAGDSYRFGAGGSKIAPVVAEIFALSSFDLGDANIDMPDTSLAFSADGRRLAIGSFGGDLLMTDPLAGDILWQKRIPDGFAKRLVFSADGKRLYVGSQSPDADLLALDAHKGKELWRVKLSEHVQSSRLPPGNDRYGIYELPAAQRMLLLPGDRLLIAASHAWTQADGERRNSGRVLLYGADGEQLAAWPTDGAAAVSIPALTASADGHQIAFACSLSAAPTAGEQHEPGGVYLLDYPAGASAFTLRWGGAPPPVDPYPTAMLWSALSLSPDGSVLMAGWADGRARFYPSDAQGPGLPPPLQEANPGLPLSIDGIPVASGVGFGSGARSGFAFQTTLSLVPWTADTSAESPPAPHPRADTLWVRDAGGAPLWSYSGPWSMGGLQMLDLPDDSARLYALAGSRSDTRKDLFGLLAWTLPAGPEPQPRLFRTQGPPFFELSAVATELGPLVAIVETPTHDKAGRRRGRYRVQVLR